MKDVIEDMGRSRFGRLWPAKRHEQLSTMEIGG